MMRALLGISVMGDANLDGVVNYTDYQIFEQHFGQSGDWAKADFDGDGEVTFADYQIIEQNWGSGEGDSLLEPLPVLRDYDGDGKVTIEDLRILQAMEGDGE